MCENIFLSRRNYTPVCQAFMLSWRGIPFRHFSLQLVHIVPGKVLLGLWCPQCTNVIHLCGRMLALIFLILLGGIRCI